MKHVVFSLCVGLVGCGGDGAASNGSDGGAGTPGGGGSSSGGSSSGGSSSGGSGGAATGGSAGQAPFVDAGGGDLAATAAKLGAGSWTELVTNGADATLANAGDHSGIITAYADKAVWDPVTKRVYFFGGDHNSTPRFVAYDAPTNTWLELGFPPWQSSGLPNNAMHGYEHIAIDPVGRALYLRPYNSMDLERLDIDTSSWTALPTIPNNVVQYNQCCTAIEYFPERNSLTYSSMDNGTNGAIAEFLPATSSWELLENDLPIGAYQNFAAYDHVHHVVWFGGGNDPGSNVTYRLDAAGKVTPLAPAPIGLGVMQTVIAADPVSGLFLVLDGSNQLRTFDAVNDVWATIPGTTPVVTEPLYPEPVVTGIIAAPIDTYGVVMYVKCHVDSCHVYLYKH